MFTPRLRIPEQKKIQNDYRGIKPDEISIQNWLNKRDHTDHNEFLNTLIAINRIQCKPAMRMTVMSILEPVINTELDKLYKQSSCSSFPISDEYLSLIDNMQQLLLESSVAYQIILHDISADEALINQYIGSLIPDALFNALFYLSRLLVERFQFYFSEPAYIWQEINQLYLLAERIGAQNYALKNKISIKHAYLKIAILKILNPYRLMRMEARKIYHLMDEWAEHCEIISYSQQMPDSNFVVDLLSDKPPHYYNEDQDAKESNSAQFEGRIVTMNKLRIFIDMKLIEVNEQKHDHVFSYQSRMHNEMLQRIDNDMSFHEERSEERLLAGNQIKLVSGLRACHYFISGRKAFKPQEEIDHQLEKRLDAEQKNDDSAINLISLLEEAKLLDKKNPMGELQSVNPFLDETDVVGDEWEHIYASSVINANLEVSEKQLARNLKEEGWQQKNESQCGMLLVSKNDVEMPIAVGMLVAYRLNVEKAYCLAIVKWLRVNPHKGMAIGIRLISVQSRAIAIKGKKGAGAGGQYQRAFLLSEKGPKGKNEQLSLIVPSGVYDKESLLNVWHNKKLSQVKVNQILQATDSFEQVFFDSLAKVKKKKALKK